VPTFDFCSTYFDFWGIFMKKILLATSALLATVCVASAADLAARHYAKAPVAPIATVYDWTGFYIGGHVGGGWGDQGSTELPPGTGAFPAGTVFAKNHPSGFLGGVQGGYNWQFSNVVLGVEGEYSWADMKGDAQTASIPIPAIVTHTTTKVDDIATVTGRIGYAFNNWLFYGKGGWAWARTGSNSEVTRSGVPFNYTSSRSDRDGWVLGAGIEWGFAPNWSAKIEYEHIDLGNKTVQINSTAAATSFVDSSSRIDVVKAGVNYRFNWGGPVVARY
jgi:outer membrane immunogenic protein